MGNRITGEAGKRCRWVGDFAAADRADRQQVIERQAEIGEAGPGPQTEAYRARRYEQRVLEDDNDERVVEEDLEAGAVIRMADPLYERWKRHFTGESSSNANNQDSEDVSMVDGSKPSNHFHPFASELDYKIADWMVQNNPGHNAFDRLLAIPGVCSFLQFPPNVFLLLFHRFRLLRD